MIIILFSSFSHPLTQKNNFDYLRHVNLYTVKQHIVSQNVLTELIELI